MLASDDGEREIRFKSLLERLSGSPLYRRKLQGALLENWGLDRLAELPLTTKEDLREGGTFGNLAVETSEVAQYFESTGTSGEPSSSWFTQEDLRTGGRQIADSGVGLTAEDLVLVRFPYALALPAFLMQQAAWRTGAGIVPASGRTVVTPYPRVLDLLHRLRVTVMAGLPREMELLAETARLLGFTANKDFPSLRAICVAGELMGDKRRSRIESLWGVPVFNLYGSTETANMATACSFGSMHVAEGDFIVEALREDGSGPVPDGERGFAAITTLAHQGSPLLRYFNGDIVSLDRSDCPCGRHGSKLRHYGRSKDRILYGATVLDAYDIQEAVYALSPVPDAWMAYEDDDGLRFVLDSHEAERWSEERVRSELSEALRVPVTVRASGDSGLLDRVGLVGNATSAKPVYIQKRERKGGST